MTHIAIAWSVAEISMTAQISDKVTYKGTNYSLAEINGNGLFDLRRYGMEPVAPSTCFWRGYFAAYEVKDGLLLLQTLLISLTDPWGLGIPHQTMQKQALAIEGRQPRLLLNESMFEYAYESMELPIVFSGSLLLGDGFIKQLSVHAGFHPAWKYRTVHELGFREGKLLQAIDRSVQMSEIRSKMIDLSGQPKSHAETSFQWP